MSLLLRKVSTQSFKFISELSGDQELATGHQGLFLSISKLEDILLVQQRYLQLITNRITTGWRINSLSYHDWLVSLLTSKKEFPTVLIQVRDLLARPHPPLRVRKSVLGNQLDSGIIKKKAHQSKILDSQKRVESTGTKFGVAYPKANGRKIIGGNSHPELLERLQKHDLPLLGTIIEKSFPESMKIWRFINRQIVRGNIHLNEVIKNPEFPMEAYVVSNTLRNVDKDGYGLASSLESGKFTAIIFNRDVWTQAADYLQTGRLPNQMTQRIFPFFPKG